jgi:DNA-binding MarR family transcriptional regulator
MQATANHPVPVQLGQFLAELDSVALGLRQRLESQRGVATGESRLLQLLGEHASLTVPQLARLRGTSRQNIQILVNRLASEGCVELNGNPAHKRSALVRLTEQGRARLTVAEDQDQQLEKELLARLSETEFGPALELIRRLRQAISRVESNSGPPPQGAKRRGPEKNDLITKSESVPETPGLNDEPNDFGLPVNLL